MPKNRFWDNRIRPLKSQKHKDVLGLVYSDREILFIEVYAVSLTGHNSTQTTQIWPKSWENRDSIILTLILAQSLI